MATNKKSIKEIYDDGMAEVYKIVGSFESTQEQRDTALQTAQDLSSMLISQTLDSINGRTALLSGLIVELNQVIESVQTNPPYEDSMKNLTSILTKAQKLFGDEKQNLI
jgi:hypothetical protein